MPTKKQGITMLLDRMLILASNTKALLKGTLLVLGLIVLTACGQEEKKDDVTRIGVAIPNFDDTFMVI